MNARRWLAAGLATSGVAALAAAVALAVWPDSSPSRGDCVSITSEDHSVARVWNEAALDAIRRDFPSPVGHARNLYHLSVAMWDAWAAYDDAGTGVIVDVTYEADDLDAARHEAISVAAHRVLSHRYSIAIDGPASLAQFNRTLDEVCVTLQDDPKPGSPAELGELVAAGVIEAGLGDGSLEEEYYYDGSYEAVNEPLVVSEPGTTMADPNRWQPLTLEEAQSQTGHDLESDTQIYIGPHWGFVEPFALEQSPSGLPLDPGAPPLLTGDPAGDAVFQDAALEVVEYSSLLSPTTGDTIDIGPGSLGDNTLGANDGDGYELNPITGAPYAPNEVLLGDFGRVVAEFWADGPDSETPPGHWNTIANAVSDDPALERRIGGAGEVVDRLEWDTKLYLALNGANHDAAIAAWGAKAHYDYSRPISMIRHLAGNGQSSDPDLSSYDPNGLPLVSGLSELITAETTAPGGRHEHLADFEGDIAIYAWTGVPEDPESDLADVGWIRAVEWVPYQQETFVTPAFAAYVSGHSTFSRASAEVLTQLTGSPFFPGGLGEWIIPAGSLEFEEGPTEDIRLQWASYYDAADQAGISRLYGGIHVIADDIEGRLMGARCGELAWREAATHFGL